MISFSSRQQLVCCDSGGWFCKGLRNSQENELWVLCFVACVYLELHITQLQESCIVVSYLDTTEKQKNYTKHDRHKALIMN